MNRIGRLICYLTMSHRLTRTSGYAFCVRCDQWPGITGWGPPPETVERHICLNDRCRIR